MKTNFEQFHGGPESWVSTLCRGQPQTHRRRCFGPLLRRAPNSWEAAYSAEMSLACGIAVGKWLPACRRDTAIQCGKHGVRQTDWFLRLSDHTSAWRCAVWWAGHRCREDDQWHPRIAVSSEDEPHDASTSREHGQISSEKGLRTPPWSKWKRMSSCMKGAAMITAIARFSLWSMSLFGFANWALNSAMLRA